TRENLGTRHTLARDPPAHRQSLGHVCHPRDHVAHRPGGVGEHPAVHRADEAAVDAVLEVEDASSAGVVLREAGVHSDQGQPVATGALVEVAGHAVEVVADVFGERVAGVAEDRQAPPDALTHRAVGNRRLLPGEIGGCSAVDGGGRLLLDTATCQQDEEQRRDLAMQGGHSGSRIASLTQYLRKIARGGDTTGRSEVQPPALSHIRIAMITRNTAKARWSIAPFICKASRAPIHAPANNPAASSAAALMSTLPDFQYSITPKTATGSSSAASEVPVALWIGNFAKVTRAATITTPPPMPNSPERTPAPRPTSASIALRNSAP